MWFNIVFTRHESLDTAIPVVINTAGFYIVYNRYQSLSNLLFNKRKIENY
ncbi:hypothetical protein VRK_15130 [Vibrio sp. MEBiC08052]|nr:hypothetical protein VRK_15130 [Vibrio sp. MEBiC08052]